jgi:hypothetical protein
MTPLDAVQQQLDIICCGHRGTGKPIQCFKKKKGSEEFTPFSRSTLSMFKALQFFSL